MGYIGKTNKGYDFFEASSAFQKSLRRGEEDTCMKFAVEMFESGYGEYLWKRLKIVVSEDVGLANETLPATIQSLYQSFLEQKKKKDEKNVPERLFLVHAILLVCRSPKSRLVDWTLINYWKNYPNNKPEIPDYAYDKHNQKGRSMGRGIKHFYETGSILNNMEKQEGEDDMKEKSFRSEMSSKTLFD